MSADASVETQVEASTTAGLVRGAWRKECAVFLGIPFAEPPVGPLRFAAPVPHGPWEGVRDALNMGATPQRGNDGGITLIPEPSVPGPSTLNVNVFTSSPGIAAGLPVLVYIHGGGFTSGSPASTWYDGTAFARDGAVTVVISYRLGFEGFGWVEGAPHNRGVMDWMLALEWVQQNVAAFGGDPGRVTIAGQSAGGGAVLTLLGMPSAQNLFSAVYCSSGVAADVTVQKSREFAAKLAERAGVAATRAGFESVDEEVLLELQKKATTPEGPPLKALRSLADDGLILGPVMDGDLIVQSTIESIRTGVGADKPLVIGANDDEFSMIFAEAKNKLKWIPAGFMLGRIGLRGPKRRAYLQANAEVKSGGTAAVMGRYLTDSIFRAFIPRLLEARGSASTWVYRFSWRSPVHDCAFHCLEVPFFFDLLDTEGVAAIAGDNPPQAVANELHAAASRFLADGDPGWPGYGTKGLTKVFDSPSTVMANGYAAVVPLP
ncbi:carboxylesterase/lipase family protein [Arthrobacter glacialis]|uniref:carboxylesterase/lipase family protein n=1 Tax=Arthrobacter glacialis TaxID=1664 RepID=UPI000CD4777E|nr:carboxylesterase family protein [Arthrobacter glacialis]POH58963.1 carboxylesterase [Arthrobacter glacialis]